MHDLAGFLKAYMEERGLSLRDMEQRARVSRSLLNNLINGKETEPRLSTLEGIARAVELPLWRIIELAGVDLGLPDEPSYDAERLMLAANQNKLFRSVLFQLLQSDGTRLYTVWNYLEAPDNDQVHDIRMSIVDDRYQLLTEKLLALAPKLLADVPPRSNIYEGKRHIPKSSGEIARALVTVNGQSLVELLGWTSGLEWGYPGAGPSSLASAMLRYEYGLELERKYSGMFFQMVTIALPHEYKRSGTIWMLESQQIDLWLLLMRLIEQADAQGMQ
ncbi:MAG: helix-turn-helix transcriptional regulator [Chloroflexales bacterium]|nr:helix-turn-helix transcriptional regulator [Chloroflexales bacterium]